MGRSAYVLPDYHITKIRTAVAAAREHMDRLGRRYTTQPMASHSTTDALRISAWITRTMAVLDRIAADAAQLTAKPGETPNRTTPPN